MVARYRAMVNQYNHFHHYHHPMNNSYHLVSIYYVPGTVLKTLCPLSCGPPTSPLHRKHRNKHKMESDSFFPFYSGNLRLREVKGLAQGHKGGGRIWTQVISVIASQHTQCLPTSWSETINRPDLQLKPACGSTQHSFPVCSYHRERGGRLLIHSISPFPLFQAQITSVALQSGHDLRPWLSSLFLLCSLTGVWAWTGTEVALWWAYSGRIVIFMIHKFMNSGVGFNNFVVQQSFLSPQKSR